MQSSRNLSASSKNVQPPSSGWKSKPSRETEISSEDGNCTMLRNVCQLLSDYTVTAVGTSDLTTVLISDGTERKNEK
jgi:hypothetical protein